MALINDVRKTCDRLVLRGWRSLFKEVTGGALDISQPSNKKLAAELIKPLDAITAEHKGFEDFHPDGRQAITGGSPARSLLYHAFASPDVHPTTNGEPSPDPEDYPTLKELDDIENYIYSLVSDRVDLEDTVVAVFAYQYRPANRSPHRRHADTAYSRTGVARVGTAQPHYDASRRSFWVIPKSGGDAISVLPARYGAFLARRAKPGAAGSVQGGHTGRRDEDFYFPLHKLFDGKECLDGKKLELNFEEFHRNEKLLKTHSLPVEEGGLPVPAGFDISKFPYIRDSQNGGNLAKIEKVGSSRLIVPVPAAFLSRTVAQKNSVTKSNQVVHFIVPTRRPIQRSGRENRFVDSTFEIPAFGRDRFAPEYVNIRHGVNPKGPINQKLEDLNGLRDGEFKKKMKDGNYPAAHFTDDSCDGCLEVVAKGLEGSTSVKGLPAFSLITAPDFFPLADQVEIDTDSTIIRTEPLSKGRLPVNPTLPRPSKLTEFAFSRNDMTVTAIVGDFARGKEVPIMGQKNRMVSYLPDGASNVFAPGWDTSRSRDAIGAFLTSSGLGSPFPEDAKLCAALSSYWPAVAPDNSRTFGNENWSNQLPMLDNELGFHPNHERVHSSELEAYRGWDGEYGPFFERIGRKSFVNYVAIERSDYVSQTLAGRIRVSLTAEVQSEEIIARNNALKISLGLMATRSHPIRCLVVFRKIDDWRSFGGRPEVEGGGYLLEFAELPQQPFEERRNEIDKERIPTDEIERVRRTVKKRHICQVGSNGVAYRNGRSAFVFHPFSNPFV